MTTVGRIHSVNCSPGGVPKLPVEGTLVTTEGLLGDLQADRKHHGGPDRAVSLYSLERIHSLQAEGHPIDAGTAGENLTVKGIDWNLIEPGTVLEAGAALLEVTSYASPCRTIRNSFLAEEFVRISPRLHPGWSRVYARVLREGHVRPDDLVSLVKQHPGNPG